MKAAWLGSTYESAGPGWAEQKPPTLPEPQPHKQQRRDASSLRVATEMAGEAGLQPALIRTVTFEAGQALPLRYAGIRPSRLRGLSYAMKEEISKGVLHVTVQASGSQRQACTPVSLPSSIRLCSASEARPAAGVVCWAPRLFPIRAAVINLHRYNNIFRLPADKRCFARSCSRGLSSRKSCMKWTKTTLSEAK